MIRELPCIVCPRGCQLRAELDESGAVLGVTGNACPRGHQYALDECTHPMRTITSTVRAENGDPVPVKTDRTVPKERMFDCMEQINKAQVRLPVKIGDVVIEDLCGTGANLVVTANRE